MPISTQPSGSTSRRCGHLGAVIDDGDVRSIDDVMAAAIHQVHSVVGDFGGQHRVIQRVTLRGDAPR